VPVNLLLLTYALAAAPQPPAHARVPADARTAISTANAAWLPAMKREDAEPIAAPYANRAVFVLPNGAAIHGRPAITTSIRQGFVRTGTVVGGALVQDGLTAAGDLLYEWGHAHLELSPAPGRRRHATGRYLNVWKKSPEGAWRVIRGLSLPGAPAAAAQSVAVPVLQPREEDVATIDGIVGAFYDVISGPAGQPRQWGRDRTLYVPGIQFVAMSERNGRPVMDVMTHQQYVDGSNAGFVRDGFFEREIHRVVSRFGHIAQVFSTYETRRKADGPVVERGVNSLQLAWDGERWWIASATWDDERPGNPIPPELLPSRTPR
jgi:ketosteroid isomerase-like protein